MITCHVIFIYESCFVKHSKYDNYRRRNVSIYHLTNHSLSSSLWHSILWMPQRDIHASLRWSLSKRRRLTAYCSCREPHQPEKLFPDQIRQRPNIDRWKASRFCDRAHITRQSFTFLLLFGDWQLNLICNFKNTSVYMPQFFAFLFSLSFQEIHQTSRYSCLVRINFKIFSLNYRMQHSTL